MPLILKQTHILREMAMQLQSSSKNRGFIHNFFSLFGTPTEPKESVIDTEVLLRLQELHRNHTFINAELNTRSGRYQSLIIDIDSKSKSLLIDELFPAVTDSHIGLGESITITSSERGMPVKFISTISAIEMYQGSPAYRITLPSSVKANQRRAFYRLPVSRDMGMRLRVPLSGLGLRLCEIINISSEGIALRIDKNISSRVQKDRILKGVELSLPDDEIIFCNLEVVSFEFKKAPYRCTQLGCRFNKMDKHDQKSLDRILVQLQRELKKLSGSADGEAEG